MASQLIHTCYRIGDIDRSVAFYAALGMEETGRMRIRDEATNVFMTGVPGRITEQPEDDFPRRCVHPEVDCESFTDPVDWDRGFMVGGLWTNGKLVHLDALINNLDWAAPENPRAHRWVALYRDEEGADVEVRIGSGRGNDASPPGASATGARIAATATSRSPAHPPGTSPPRPDPCPPTSGP